MRRRIFINRIMRNWIDGFYRNFHSRLSEYFRRELKSELYADDDLYRKRILHDREFYRELDREFGRKFDYDNFNIQTLITIVRGSHSKLLTGEQLKAAHTTSEKESDLINDDLEEFNKLTLAQSVKEKRIDDFKCLSFYKQPTDPEVEKLKPFQYEIEMKQQNWKHFPREALLSLLAQTDPGYQYLKCDCQRQSFSMSLSPKWTHMDKFKDHKPVLSKRKDVLKIQVQIN